MFMTNSFKGQYAVLMVEKRALEKGFLVSHPISSQCRYDLIIDDGNTLFRVQVKYGNVKTKESGASKVCLRKNNKPYLTSEIDALAIYLPILDKICWVTGNDFHGKKALQIRLEPSKNGQIDKCFFANEHLW